MNTQVNDLYYTEHITNTLIQHGLQKKVAEEMAKNFLLNPQKRFFSIHDQKRIEYLDSLSESENRNAWKDYLATRSGQVIETDKRALERYLYCTIQRLIDTNKIIAKHEGYFKNTVTDIGSIIWSSNALDFINEWQNKNPDGGDKQYTHVQLSFSPGTSIPGSFFQKN